ncbi:MAG: response regulator [Deltaproteobacteria bacterium]|nr:response regulator [Deltaproteobacteria bacterium]
MNKILIVDDEPVILTVLQSILARTDREFLVAETAGQALSLAGRCPSLEVALVDKNLPDRTGLDVARELKHLHPDVEVILLTGYASLDSAIEAVKVGAFDYIQKPIEDFDDLNLKVQNAAEKVRLKRDQRRLLDRFAESEERHRGVFQASCDAILVCDADLGRIQDANSAAQRLYGYSQNELAAMTVDRLGVGIPREGNAGLAAQRHVRKDGSSFAAEVSFGQFLFQRRAMRIVAVRDVTERERAERERAALEEHLRHAQKMDALGRVADRVAHDFDDLLALVVGNAQLIAAGSAEQEKTRERARDILDVAQRATRLTRQLLTFSHKRPAPLEPLDLNTLVRDSEKVLRHALGNDLDLVAVSDPALGRARADGEQMGQVLLNLVLNARDAMAGRAGAKLVIETANVDLDDQASTRQAGLSPGRYVTLAVSDNGRGMTREVQERLFEPFFTTREPGKGTGLGLATVYAIVQQAGGTVQAHSEPEVGTTFKVFLPRLDEVERAAAPAQPPPGR